MASKKSFKSAALPFISSATEEEPEQIRKDSGTLPRGYIMGKETKSERVQLLLRPSIKDGIKELAKEEGRSVNDLINDALAEYLERNK